MICTNASQALEWMGLCVLGRASGSSTQTARPRFPQGLFSRSNLRVVSIKVIISCLSSSSRVTSLGEGITRIKRQIPYLFGFKYWAHNFDRLN